MIDVRLDPGLNQVQQLVHMNIIYPGTGLTFPAGDEHSSPYAYYSMTTWVFYYLIRNPILAGVYQLGEKRDVN